MIDVSAERWESLRRLPTKGSMTVEPAEADCADCLLGIDRDGRLHLLLALARDPLSLPPDLQSIESRLVEDERTWLDVSSQRYHQDLFTMLVNKVLYAVRVEGRDPATSVEATIDELRAALKPVALELGVSEQIGLFGELWVLWNVLFPTLGARVSDAWSGPLGERHDFVGTSVHIEVKTTTRSEEKHEITRLDQLKPPPGKRLLVASVLLERSLAGTDTLATMVDNIVAGLGTDGRSIDLFQTKLRKLGWSDGLRQSGALLKFNLRDAHLFEVEGSFPRLPDDYVPPRGVTGIKYTIDVAARPSLSVDSVKEILKSM